MITVAHLIRRVLPIPMNDQTDIREDIFYTLMVCPIWDSHSSIGDP